MAKEGGLGQRLLVGGVDISGDITALDTASLTQGLGDVTDITQYAHSRLGLLRDGSMSFTNLMDSALAHPVLSALPTTDVLFTWLLGTSLADPAACLNALEASYEGTREANGMLTFKTQAQADGYALEWGQQLTPGVRTDTSGTPGTAVDYGASSSYGAQFYLQVTALTGTDVVVEVEESADDSSWSALATFTAATSAPYTQRMAVTGAVDRYLRVLSSGTFSSASFSVAGIVNPAAIGF